MNRELIDELIRLAEKIFSSGSKDSTLQSLREENSSLREENSTLLGETTKLKSQVFDLSQENVNLKQSNIDLQTEFSQSGENKVSLDKYVETRVLLEEKTKKCSDQEKQLEEYRKRESSLNIAGYAGKDMEDRVVEFLEDHFGGMTESIARTGQKEIGDIHMRFISGIMIMVEVKNSSLGRVNSTISPKDEKKFLEDAVRCVPKPDASVLFAIKQVHADHNIIVRHSNTIFMVGNGNTQKFIQCIQEAYLNASLERNNPQPVINLDPIPELFEGMATMHETEITTYKTITKALTKLTNFKSSHIPKCFDLAGIINTKFDGILSRRFLNALTIGIKSSTLNKSGDSTQSSGNKRKVSQISTSSSGSSQVEELCFDFADSTK